ncbi:MULTISPECIES: tetratricopeptide repeat protein [Calothrix]|uniref:Tetratricopeptide repeat protein n=2 Tax=Calothrix TaxID=1186 RepID=A0ABR8AC65_9CYAN|nr:MULTISPECIES: tetratricopeptide repeat protein [Calothrix]MBD2197612.1 tetratricopeptide repeat protein [Calothrix parietina FACHB-288]MBD2227432.1 tetratricopeptide repeat protein [Calothrix anomala FACHB-343]
MGAGEEYLINRKKQIQRRQKFLTIVSIACFLGPILFSAVPVIQKALQEPQPKAVTQKSPDVLLQEQAKGWEMVLQREPQNQLALEGLVNVRIKLNDTQGAIQILEKLVKLHPERQDYKVVLEKMKQEVGK